MRLRRDVLLERLFRFVGIRILYLCWHVDALYIDKSEEKKYGKYYGGKTHHNIDAYLRSDYEHAAKVFEDEIRTTLPNHVRSENDIQRNIYSYVALAEKRAHLHYVTQRTSFRLHIQNESHYGKLERYNPILFCMNDSQYAKDCDRKRAAAFLDKRFPEKSQYEK